jgi:hypothetical protein
MPNIVLQPGEEIRTVTTVGEATLISAGPYGETPTIGGPAAGSTFIEMNGGECLHVKIGSKMAAFFEVDGNGEAIFRVFGKIQATEFELLDANGIPVPPPASPAR